MIGDGRGDLLVGLELKELRIMGEVLVGVEKIF